jgi:ATP-dependent Clp protease protease subunit
MIADNCGKTVEEVANDTDRDNWMSAEEAVAYGLIDKIVEKRPTDNTEN